jgi:hypothetical protein
METENLLGAPTQRILAQWDFIKIMEPNGVDKLADESARNSILNALAEGFEPFAVVPTMVKATQFSQPIVSNQVYFKRPSFTKEKVDESDRIIK